jgi:hypothetical protein
MVAAAPALFDRGTATQAHATSGLRQPAYVAPPNRMTPGYCWFCGGKVKPNTPICLHCGSTQNVIPEESELAQRAGFNPTRSSMPIARPTDGPVLSKQRRGAVNKTAGPYGGGTFDASGHPYGGGSDPYSGGGYDPYGEGAGPTSESGGSYGGGGWEGPQGSSWR